MRARAEAARGTSPSVPKQEVRSVSKSISTNGGREASVEGDVPK